MPIGKKNENKVYSYRLSAKITLVIIILCLTVMIPFSFNDPASWVSGIPVVSIASAPPALAFIWILLRDSGQKITLRGDGIACERGIWRFRRSVEVKWGDIRQIRDTTPFFGISRKYSLVVKSDPIIRVSINSSLRDYKLLLREIVRRLPIDRIEDKAVKSLTRIRVMKAEGK